MGDQSSQPRRPTTNKQLPEPHSRAKWTASLIKILVDSMVDQVERGNKKSQSFGKDSWKNICDNFFKKTGLKWEKEQLKYRYVVLRKQYAMVKSILDQSDFEWNEQTGAIIATDAAWDRYIVEHPDADALRSAGCPIYTELCKIFGEPRQNRIHNGLVEVSEPHGILFPKPLNAFIKEEIPSASDEEADMVDEQDNFHLKNASKDVRKRGRRGVEDFIANALMEMAAASKLRTDAINKYNDRYPISDCIRALDEMQVDQQLYFAALDLFNKRSARETFLSLKANRRLTWLRGKC